MMIIYTAEASESTILPVHNPHAPMLHLENGAKCLWRSYRVGHPRVSSVTFQKDWTMEMAC